MAKTIIKSFLKKRIKQLTPAQRKALKEKVQNKKLLPKKGRHEKEALKQGYPFDSVFVKGARKRDQAYGAYKLKLKKELDAGTLKREEYNRRLSLRKKL